MKRISATNTRKSLRDRDVQKYWRKVLPGVPNDEIVVPRYHAKYYGLPPTASKRTDDPDTWHMIRSILDQAIFQCSPLGCALDDARLIRNTAARAFRWWDSLHEPTPLKMNQTLYVRRNMWKNKFDMPEFFVCWSLCQAWFNLPKNKRSARVAKATIRTMLNDAMRRRITGEPPRITAQFR